MQRLLGQYPAWRERALTRGTSVAEANIFLGAKVSGRDLSHEYLSRCARGLGPEERAPSASGSQAEADNLSGLLAAAAAALSAAGKP